MSRHASIAATASINIVIAESDVKNKSTDPTRNARQARRVAELQAAALRDGFRDGVVNGRNSMAWSQALTAWKNGVFVMVPAFPLRKGAGRPPYPRRCGDARSVCSNPTGRK
jgi:hypothetical protein